MKTVFDTLNTWLTPYNSLITAIGATGSILAVGVAWQIYFRGIRRNNKRILQQVGFEFAVEFIIPFYELINALHFVLKEEESRVDVHAVCSILKVQDFLKEFPYWETHKSDVWEALMKNRGIRNRIRNQIQRMFSEEKYLKELHNSSAKYKNIQEFVQAVQSSRIGIKVLRDSMYEYLYPSKELNSLNETNTKSNENGQTIQQEQNEEMLKDYLKASMRNEEYYRKGIRLLNEMQTYIIQLPEELFVEHYIQRISNNREQKNF